MSENAKELNAENFDDFIAQGKSVIDFWADWCSPCKMMAPVFDEVAKKFKGKIGFGKVNIDDNSKLAEKFGVMSIPTLVFFKDGKEVSRNSGFIDSESLKDMVKEGF
jgi:thioredoxin 1